MEYCFTQREIKTKINTKDIFQIVKENALTLKNNIFKASIFSLGKSKSSALAGKANVLHTGSQQQIAEELLDDYGNSILRYAYSYLHNLNDAEEILQETLIQYLKANPKFENINHEKAWLFRVAGNLSKNRLKYNAIRETDQLAEELVANNNENLAFLWDEVKKLPENQRNAIHLFYYEGFSTKEIAEILEMKESSVRSNLHRGRESLKAILKEEYDFNDNIE